MTDTTKKIYSYDELKEILRLHAMWLRDEEDGKRADLSYAVLSYADLSYADLRHADLSCADLSYADLRHADLSCADLSYAVLNDIKNDLITAILMLPDEIPFLRQTLLDGKIDGSTYEGDCSCLAGTMAHACRMGWDSFKSKALMPIDENSPREHWVMGIKKGDTPENSCIAKITLEWIDEAIAMVDHIRKGKAV